MMESRASNESFGCYHCKGNTMSNSRACTPASAARKHVLQTSITAMLLRIASRRMQTCLGATARIGSTCSTCRDMAALCTKTPGWLCVMILMKRALQHSSALCCEPKVRPQSLQSLPRSLASRTGYHSAAHTCSHRVFSAVS